MRKSLVVVAVFTIVLLTFAFSVAAQESPEVNASVTPEAPRALAVAPQWPSGLDMLKVHGDLATQAWAAEQEALRVAQEAERARQAAARRNTPRTPSVPQAPTSYESSGRCAIPDYICQRESGFNPNAVNPTGCGGRGCYNKYQFDPRTWDSVARSMGRDDLVGNYIPPEADQDAVAAHLFAEGRGCGHWNACK